MGCPLAPGESENYEEIELGEDPGITAKLVAAVKKAVKIPVGIKLSPTIRRLDRIAIAAQRDGGADFCTAVNAPGGFSIDIEREEIRGANTFVGYIPGPSLKWWGLSKVAQIKQACDIEVSGCGGIFTANDAIEYILLGCPTIQVVSSVYFKGARVFPEILDGIEAFMDRKGYNTIDDFRGNVLNQVKQYREVPHEEVIRVYPSPILPVFDIEKCNFCMQCVTSCIHDAIKADRDGGTISVVDEECFGCGFCAGICPTSAVSIVHINTGKLVWSGNGAIDPEWVNW